MKVRRYVTLEEKIEIFKRFSKTEERLTSNTVFEGYPVGMWAIQIRNMLNHQKIRKDIKMINPTEKQLEVLQDLGILERRNSTIDEKIDMLVKWMKKYPNAEIGKRVPEDILREYVTTEEEYAKFIAEYEKMQKYYDYIRGRNSHKKLTREQISKCKEGNVRGIFGYPTQVKNLAKKTGQSEKNIEYIIINYGTMDNFIELYRKGELVGKSALLAHSMIRDVLDIDLSPDSGKFDRLYCDIMKMSTQPHSLELYSGEKLRNALETLEPREKYILEKRYELLGESPRSLVKIAPEVQVSPERVRQLWERALTRLGYLSMTKKFSIRLDETYMLSDEERNMLETLRDELYASDFIFRNSSLSKLQNDSENEHILRAFKHLKDIYEIEENKIRQMEEEKEEESKINITDEIINIDIRELGMSSRTCTALRKADIETLGDIAQLTEKDLIMINGIGRNAFNEIIQRIREYGISLREDVEEESESEAKKCIKPENNKNLAIEELGLSNRVYNALKRNHINTLADISNLTIRELMNIRQFGEKCIMELNQKIGEYGISLRKDSQENPRDQIIAEMLTCATKRAEVREKEEQAAKLEEQYEEQASENVHLLDDDSK